MPGTEVKPLYMGVSSGHNNQLHLFLKTLLCKNNKLYIKDGHRRP